MRFGLTKPKYEHWDNGLARMNKLPYIFKMNYYEVIKNKTMTNLTA